MLQFTSEVEVRDSVELGTVRELVGEGGTVELNPRNFIGTNRLMITLVKKNGNKAKVLCSPTVSKLFRKKEITVGELLSLSVFEEEAKDGSIINVIEMPKSDQQNHTIEVDEVEEATYVAEEISFEPTKRIAF